MSELSLLKDQATTNDELRFGDFRSALRSAIVNSPTPVTIGIFGDWGSGKTSLMKMLEEDLRCQHQTVWFDSWKFSDEEVLSRALILSVIRAFRPKDADDEDLDKIEAKLYQATTRDVTGSLSFDWCEAAKATLKVGISMLPVIGGSFGELWHQLSGKSAADFKTLVGALQKDTAKVHRERIRFLDEFQDTFGDLVRERVEADKRLIVFIDDLDRCLPEDAVRVLEAIKLYLDVERCVYVVGVDSRVIERGIRVRYKDFRFADGRREETAETGEFPISGRDYLEKLIQLPFHLPPMQAVDMERFVQTQHPDSPAGLAEACATGLEANPRKVKRAINIFRLLWEVAQQRDDLKGVIKPELLGKLVVIQSRWRDDLYLDIKETPEFLQVLERRAQPVVEKEAPSGEGPPPPAPTTQEATASPLDGKPRPHPEELPHARMMGSAESIQREEERYQRYLEQRPLVGLLRSGEERFDRLESEALYKYIFLAGTTGPTESPARPVDRELWTRLFSSDEASVRNARAELMKLPEADLKSYFRRLRRTTEDPSQALTVRTNAAFALAILGDPRLDETVRIPAGPFLMGTPPDHVDRLWEEHGKRERFLERDWLLWETPQRTVHLDEYEIDRYPVTNAQYKKFVDATGHGSPPGREGESYPPDRANHPVVDVTWDDAAAYAKWAGKRLPTEAQWEKAARGTEGLLWPWGNEWQDDCCNSEEAGIGGTTPVGLFPKGRSPYGVDDMAGNVWEWCADWFGEDYYKSGENENPAGPERGDYRVLRGGTYWVTKIGARCAYRIRDSPDGRVIIIGFRCAR